MILGVFLAIGESLKDFQKKGQLKRIVNYNFKSYSSHFEKVYIFSYDKEFYKLPKNCQLIPNKYKLHRYLYSLALPFIESGYIKKCDILRGYQLTGGIPALISKIIFIKKYVINYGYDYVNFAKIENKKVHALIYQAITGPILKLADNIIITSKTQNKSIRKDISKNKIIYIPNGVDLKLFHPGPPKKETQPVKILYIGRIEPQKNLEQLIQALRDLNNFSLTFYGTGTLNKKLINIARELKVKLSIKKPVDYYKLPKIFDKFDVFTLPSLEEGNPKILIEAMASAMPVLGTNVRGIKELIMNHQNGILTQTNALSIRNGILQFKSLTTRRKLGDNARKFAQANFDIDLLLEMENKLLKKVANG